MAGKFYEVIFETGDHSIAFYESDEEALSALKAHHARAMAGEPGGPAGHRAERVKRILVYDSDPGTQAPTISKSDVSTLLDATDSHAEFVNKLNDLASPIVHGGPHESNYTAKESRELDLAKAGIS